MSGVPPLQSPGGALNSWNHHGVVKLGGRLCLVMCRLNCCQCLLFFLCQNSHLIRSSHVLLWSNHTKITHDAMFSCRWEMGSNSVAQRQEKTQAEHVHSLFSYFPNSRLCVGGTADNEVQVYPADLNWTLGFGSSKTQKTCHTLKTDAWPHLLISVIKVQLCHWKGKHRGTGSLELKPARWPRLRLWEGCWFVTLLRLSLWHRVHVIWFLDFSVWLGDESDMFPSCWVTFDWEGSCSKQRLPFCGSLRLVT